MKEENKLINLIIYMLQQVTERCTIINLNNFCKNNFKRIITPGKNFSYQNIYKHI